MTQKHQNEPVHKPVYVLDLSSKPQLLRQLTFRLKMDKEEKMALIDTKLCASLITLYIIKI